MSSFPALTIRAGGQSGVDRAALDAAHRLGLSYAGWCPKGGWAEDRVTAPGVMKDYPRLTETPSDRAHQRTAWNVRDAHAVMILIPGTELESFGGSQFAYIMARLVFLRPCLVVDVRSPNDPAAARDWVTRTAAGLDLTDMVLNVAGPRETESKGINMIAYQFLTAVFGRG